MWLMPDILISTDAAGQRSDPDICLASQEQAESQEWGKVQITAHSGIIFPLLTVTMSWCSLMQTVISEGEGRSG